MTLEEYVALPDDDRYRDELSRGRLVREPGPGQEHGRVQARLVEVLGAYVREQRLGYVVSESSFVLERHPDTVRGPDVAFVARARYGVAPPKGYAEFPPDLAVEVLSPSDRPARIAEKVAQYFAAGTRIVWLIDPADRTALVYASATDVRVLRAGEVLDGDDVVPGFRCALDDLLD